jgi:hypothetical protein
MTKIYKAYVGYGKHPLTDGMLLNKVKQARDKGKGKPVNKLYKKESRGNVCVRPVDRFSLMVLGKNFKGSTEEFIQACKNFNDSY